MAARVPIIDDPAVGERMRELHDERAAWAKCTCRGGVDDRGRLVKLVDWQCPVHGTVPRPEGG